MLGQPKKRALAALLLVAAAVLGACGDGEDRPGNASASGSGSASGSHAGSGSASGSHADEGTTAETIPASEAEVTVDVVLKDFTFEGIPSTIEGHKILFRAKNDGPTEHELVIRKGTKELGEIHGLAAGESGEIALELESGSYTAVCLIGSGGARHDKLGMVFNFTVT
ncbi:MAG TPA: hypothetical protein VHF47_12320 [Acidimicrobiales bacterium]|nr:hypothetical protein [Acidimicrobiales bacterium]